MKRVGIPELYTPNLMDQENIRHTTRMLKIKTDSETSNRRILNFENQEKYKQLASKLKPKPH